MLQGTHPEKEAKKATTFLSSPAHTHARAINHSFRSKFSERSAHGHCSV